MDQLFHSTVSFDRDATGRSANLYLPSRSNSPATAIHACTYEASEKECRRSSGSASRQWNVAVRENGRALPSLEDGHFVYVNDLLLVVPASDANKIGPTLYWKLMSWAVSSKWTRYRTRWYLTALEVGILSTNSTYRCSSSTWALLPLLTKTSLQTNSI